MVLLISTGVLNTLCGQVWVKLPLASLIWRICFQVATYFSVGIQPLLLLSFVLKSPEDILLCILDCVIIGGGRDTYHPARRARALSSYMMADTSILAGTSLLTLWPMFARGTKIFTTEGFKWNIRYCYLLSKHMILRFTDTSSRTLKYTACLHLIIINIICI